MDIFFASVVLAILIEKITGVIKDAIGVKLPAWVWFIISSGLGIVLAILFQVDILSALGFVSPVAAAAYVGQIITGIAIGAGSGFVHDVIDKLKAGKA
jgi:hypothetical protein